jgi:hypothetical protein
VIGANTGPIGRNGGILFAGAAKDEQNQRPAGRISWRASFSVWIATAYEHTETKTAKKIGGGFVATMVLSVMMLIKQGVGATLLDA